MLMLTRSMLPVSRVRNPRLLLHRLPDVPVADKLHAASDGGAAADHQLRLRVPDVVDSVRDRRLQGPAAAATRLDMHRHHLDSLLPLHAAQGPDPQGDLC